MLAKIQALLAPFIAMLKPFMPIISAEEQAKMAVVHAWVQAELAKDGLPPEVNACLLEVDQAFESLIGAEVAKIGA
jgi:hypothetical protein